MECITKNVKSLLKFFNDKMYGGSISGPEIHFRRDRLDSDLVS